MNKQNLIKKQLDLTIDFSQISKITCQRLIVVAIFMSLGIANAQMDVNVTPIAISDSLDFYAVIDFGNSFTLGSEDAVPTLEITNEDSITTAMIVERGTGLPEGITEGSNGGLLAANTYWLRITPTGALDGGESRTGSDVFSITLPTGFGTVGDSPGRPSPTTPLRFNAIDNHNPEVIAFELVSQNMTINRAGVQGTFSYNLIFSERMGNVNGNLISIYKSTLSKTALDLILASGASLASIPGMEKVNANLLSTQRNRDDRVFNFVFRVNDINDASSVTNIARSYVAVLEESENSVLFGVNSVIRSANGEGLEDCQETTWYNTGLRTDDRELPCVAQEAIIAQVRVDDFPTLRSVDTIANSLSDDNARIIASRNVMLGGTPQEILYHAGFSASEDIHRIRLFESGTRRPFEIMRSPARSPTTIDWEFETRDGFVLIDDSDPYRVSTEISFINSFGFANRSEIAYYSNDLTEFTANIFTAINVKFDSTRTIKITRQSSSSGIVLRDYVVNPDDGERDRFNNSVTNILLEIASAEGNLAVWQISDAWSPLTASSAQDVNNAAANLFSNTASLTDDNAYEVYNGFSSITIGIRDQAQRPLLYLIGSTGGLGFPGDEPIKGLFVSQTSPNNGSVLITGPPCNDAACSEYSFEYASDSQINLAPGGTISAQNVVILSGDRAILFTLRGVIATGSHRGEGKSAYVKYTITYNDDSGSDDSSVSLVVAHDVVIRDTALGSQDDNDFDGIPDDVIITPEILSTAVMLPSNGGSINVIPPNNLLTGNRGRVRAAIQDSLDPNDYLVLYAADNERAITGLLSLGASTDTQTVVDGFQALNPVAMANFDLYGVGPAPSADGGFAPGRSHIRLKVPLDNWRFHKLVENSDIWRDFDLSPTEGGIGIVNSPTGQCPIDTGGPESAYRDSVSGELIATAEGNCIVVEIVDGGRNDGDGVMNGRIADPLAIVRGTESTGGGGVRAFTITDSNSDANTIAETATSGTVVTGVLFVVTDEQGRDASADLIWFLTDDASGLFAINSMTGEVTLTSANLDYETDREHVMSVSAEIVISGIALTASQALTINVLNVNESITLVDNNNGTNVLAETATSGTEVTGVSLIVNDENNARVNDSIAYTLEDTSGLFRINEEGVIRYASIATLNIQTTPSYEITVTATVAPALTSSLPLTIIIVDVVRTIAITDSNSDDNTIAETATSGTEVTGVSFVVTDEQGRDASADLVWVLTDDASGLFAISSMTGAITLISANLDYETDREHIVSVSAEIMVSGIIVAANQMLTINVLNVNESITIIDNDDTENTIVETATSGTEVSGVSLLVNDEDGLPVTGTVAWSLLDNTSGLFSIDTNNGVITRTAILGIEAGSYTLSVSASLVNEVGATLRAPTESIIINVQAENIRIRTRLFLEGPLQ